MSSDSQIEALESRMLFAGVILEANGRLGTIDTFMKGLSDDITARLGGPAQVPQYILKVDADPVSGNLIPTITHVDGTGTPQTSSSGEILVLLDYYNISANANYSSNFIGQVVASYFASTPVDGVLLASLPVHEIALSRGAGILDGIASALGQSGVWVDQETYLDPDPIAAQGDPPSTIFDNVAFVDNYWRNSGVLDGTGFGHPVDGAYNLNVPWLDTNHAGWNSAHEGTSGYYVGTVDPNATQSGLGPIYDSWYGNTAAMPARDATGFIYSDLVGAARPLSGVWAASGGSGVRTATAPTGAQWGNLTDLSVTTGNLATTGGSFNVSYIHQDRDSQSTITFFLDADRNPYNNNFTATLGSTTLGLSAAIASGNQTLSLTGVAPGTYWLCAQVADAQGHVRYAYEPVTAPLTVQASASITGTVSHDASGAGTAYAGVAGRVVYIDANGTGTWAPNDPFSTTDASGNYSISNLTPGVPLRVREAVPAGKRETGAPPAPLTLSPGEVLTGINFATTQVFSAVSGSVFDDVNGDGVIDVGESGAPGRVVYVDLDGSGQWKPNDPSATTDSTGQYTIRGLLPGIPLTVREVLPAGMRETLASTPLTLIPDVTTPNVNLATSQTAKVSGAVFLKGIGPASSPVTGAGFEVILTQRPRHGKTKKSVLYTDADGSFVFSDLQPASIDTLQIVARKGYKLSPKTSGSYRLNPAPGQILGGLNFFVAPIVSSKHR